MNLEDFKKVFPYICESCRVFTHSLVEYCEHCGKKGVVRKANEFDYEEISFRQKIPVISEEKSFNQKIPVISEEEVKKCLLYSILIIAGAFLLGVIVLYFAFHTTSGIYMFLLSLIWMQIGVISLLFYFINPEISYVMLMSRKKVRKINSHHMIIGRRILMVIMIIGLGLSILVFLL